MSCKTKINVVSHLDERPKGPAREYAPMFLCSQYDIKPRRLHFL